MTERGEMREIKFRLRLDNEIVGYEKWYSGERAEVTPDTPGDLYWRASPVWLYSTDGKRWTPTLILHNRKDPCTNRPDKNGAEIYEGDIIKPIDERPWNYEVYWDDRSSSWRLRIHGEMQYDKTTSLMFAQRMEICGNIWENPELIA